MGRDKVSDNNTIKCDTHGTGEEAFLCQHLLKGEKLGFNLSYNPDHPEKECPDAWCDECEKVLEREGEWNDNSMQHAGIKLICSYCYEEIRERNWIQDDQKWDELVSDSCNYFCDKHNQFIKEFKIGEHDRWDRDQETGILTLSKNGKVQVEADFHFAGSYSTKSNSWMWAWANSSFEEKVRSESLKLKDLGEEEKFLLLASHISNIDLHDADHLVAIMAKKLDAIGCYKTGDETLTVYMIITNARWVKS